MHRYINQILLYLLYAVFCLVFILTIHHLISKEYTSAYELLGLCCLFLLFTSFLIFKKSWFRILLTLLLISHIYFNILWGHLVPYLDLLSILIVIVLIISGQSNKAKIFAIYALVTTTLEFINLLPLLYSPVKLGSENAIISFILQILVYFFLFTTSPYFILFRNIDASKMLRLQTIRGHTLTSYITKGFYLSILSHFFKNLFNTYVWTGKIEKSSIQLITLLGRISHSENDRMIEISTILKAIINYYKSIIQIKISLKSVRSLKLKNNTAQLLLMILFDLLDNVSKYSLIGKSVHINLFVNDKSFVVNLKNKSSKPLIKIRNTSIINTLLIGTQQGSLTTYYKNGNFKTKLELRH